jgi:hypothetical protein
MKGCSSRIGSPEPRWMGSRRLMTTDVTPSARFRVGGAGRFLS